jgi:hypothetical protein
MHEPDRIPRFARAITLLARTFRAEADALLLEAYAIGLERLPIDRIEAAVRICIQTARHLPTPAELADYVGAAPLSSLRKPGRWSCAACGTKLEYRDSLQRGYCGPCWRQAGGLEEDRARAAGEVVAPTVAQLESNQTKELP